MHIEDLVKMGLAFVMGVVLTAIATVVIRADKYGWTSYPAKYAVQNGESLERYALALEKSEKGDRVEEEDKLIGITGYSYVSGYIAAPSLVERNRIPFHIPDDVSFTQMAECIKGYVWEHPESRDFKPYVVIRQAFSEKYPNSDYIPQGH